MRRRIIKRHVGIREFNAVVESSLTDVNATFGGMPLHKDHPKNVEYRMVVEQLSNAKRNRVNALRQFGAGSPQWKAANATLKETQDFVKSEYNRIYQKN